MQSIQLSADADPCNAYTVLDEPKRSRFYIMGDADTAICDDQLEKKWYRFKDGNMATNEVAIQHCGTQFPIWLRGNDFVTTENNIPTMSLNYKMP